MKISRRRLLKHGIVGTAGAIAAPWLIPSGVLAATQAGRQSAPSPSA